MRGYPVYYKDGSSEVKVVGGGTPAEQAEALAQPEAKETKAKVLMEELWSITEKT